MTTNRRAFLRQTAAAAAGITLLPAYLGAAPPTGRRPDAADLTIGLIGCGRQGQGLVRNLARVSGARLVAACDVHPGKLAHLRQQVQTASAAGAEADDVAAYADYRALLDHDGLDAVIVATPDHQHATICIAALDRGKHVYCEKPLAHTVEEGRAMVAATQRNGRVLQTGSMQRSMFNFQKAVELVRNGHLGAVREVIVSVGGPPVPFDLTAQDPPAGVDWSSWIGPTVDRPYHPDLLPPIDADYWGRWRHYAEFGGGMVTDWGAHMFDIVQWALDKDTTGPTRFYPPLEPEATEGLTFFYDDGVRVDHRNFGRGNAVRFIGSEGTLDVARGFIDTTVPDLLSYADMHHEAAEPALVTHLTDFVNAVQHNGTPICPAETGHRTATVCTLSNIAYRLGRPLEWDPEKERIRGDAEANRLLGDAYRSTLA